MDAGSGSVVFLEGCVRAYPEWWGASGDGTGDDAPALAAAYAAISQTGAGAGREGGAWGWVEGAAPSAGTACACEQQKQTLHAT